MKTYVLIGPKVEKGVNILTSKRQCKKHLWLSEQSDGRKYEVKKEFKAPSYEVARIVYEVYNGWIPDVDVLLKDLANYYGYKLEKK